MAGRGSWGKMRRRANRKRNIKNSQDRSSPTDLEQSYMLEYADELAGRQDLSIASGDELEPCPGCDELMRKGHNRSGHHVIPREIRDPAGLTDVEKIYMCTACHALLHQKFTNEELARMNSHKQVVLLRGLKRIGY